jgi:hypothetical protein
MARDRSFDSYEKHVRIYGPEGVLDAARRDLTEEEYERLTTLVASLKKPKRGRRG